MTVKSHDLTVKSHDCKARLGKRVRSSPALLAAVMLGCVFLASASPPLASAAAAANATKTGTATTAGAGGSSLEAAATKAGDMGRKIAMSLIGLALAVAGIVLAFHRDFRKVAGVLVVGLLAVLLATPTGLSVLQNTVNTLFGSS
jgi:phage-related tail protein